MTAVQETGEPVVQVIRDHLLYKHLPAAGRILWASPGPVEAGPSFPAETQELITVPMVPDLFNIPHETARPFKAAVIMHSFFTTMRDKDEVKMSMDKLDLLLDPGGVIYIEVLGYLAMLQTLLRKHSGEFSNPSFTMLTDKGDTIDAADAYWHFFRPSELITLAEASGFTTERIAGASGIMNCRDLVPDFGGDGQRRENWISTIVESAEEPSVVDLSERIVFIGRKR